jgi:hypothetical protein
MFHTDRGSEFDNTLIDKLLDTFRINRSLCPKGKPLDIENMKYLYSLLFYTDIRIDDKLDLYKVIKSYMWYKEGHIATIIM